MRERERGWRGCERMDGEGGERESVREGDVVDEVDKVRECEGEGWRV